MLDIQIRDKEQMQNIPRLLESQDFTAANIHSFCSRNNKIILHKFVNNTKETLSLCFIWLDNTFVYEAQKLFRDYIHSRKK